MTREASHSVCLHFRHLGRNVNKFKQLFDHDPSVLNSFHSYRHLPHVQTKRLRCILSKLVQVQVFIFWGKLVSCITTKASQLVACKGHMCQLVH
jgi:hypothetical protein